MGEVHASDEQIPRDANLPVSDFGPRTSEPRTSETHQRSENVPLTPQHRQNVSPSSTSLDHRINRLERHQISHDKKVSRRSFTEDSGGRKKPRLDRSRLNGELSLKDESRFLVPSPRAIPREDEFIASPDTSSSITSPDVVDLITRPNLPIGNLHGALDAERLPLAEAHQKSSLLVAGSTQMYPPSSVVAESVAAANARGEATSMDHSNRSVANDSTSSNKPSQPPNPDQDIISSSGSWSARPSYDLKKYHDRVTARLNWVTGNNARGLIEVSRLRLMQEACNVGDIFFLILHQLYCSHHVSRGLRPDLPGAPKDFQALERLLASNDHLMPDAVQWFSNLVTLPSIDQREIETKVMLFLSTFADRWNELLQEYPQYKLPPSSIAIAAKLPSLDSVVFEQVIFRATLRSSWVKPLDNCLEKCESAFIKNQQLVQVRLRCRRPEDRLDVASLDVLDRAATESFQKILISHLAHGIDTPAIAHGRQRSQASTVPTSVIPSSAASEGHRHHEGMNTSIAENARPPLPRLDLRAAEQHGSAQLPKGTAQSSPSTVGPFSAPVREAYRPFLTMQPFSPPTPAVTSCQLMSLPGSVAQSPQCGTQFDRPPRPIQQPRQPNFQLPLGSQAVLPSNIVTVPNGTQTRSTPQYVHGSPTAPEHQVNYVQQVNEMYPVRPILQAAQIQQGPRVQQDFYARQNISPGQMPSSTLPSAPLLSTVPSTQGNPFQQMSVIRNISDSSRSAYVQSPITQSSLPCPPQMYRNGGPYWLNPASYTPATLHAAVMTGQPNRQVSAGVTPQDLIADQFICDKATSLPQVPDPAVTAVHQAYAESPQLTFWDPQDPHKQTKGFRYIKHISYHEALSNRTKSLRWMQIIGNDIFRKLPSDIRGPIGLPFRQVSNGSCLARLRCIKLRGSNVSFNDSCWATSDMCWPAAVAVSVNGQFLEIRRKSHFGKDLAVDVTRLLRQGQNELNASVLGLPEDCTDQWLIGLEYIEVVDTARIKEMLTFETYPFCRDRILNKLRYTDPDIEVVQPQTVLDLTDPFTSRIFDVPVRGKDCTHSQCFDLDTFLETRGSAIKPEPCSPDEFRCPICKGDVRPQMMVVDGYLAFLRSELARRGRLDAKAVVVQESGAWEVKEEEDTIEERDRSAKRSTSRTGIGGTVETQLGLSLGKNNGKGKEKAQTQTIVLDDD